MKKLSAIFIGLTAIALLFTPSCKSEDVFNIVGVWDALWNYSWHTYTGTYTFSGTESSGTCSANFVGVAQSLSGTYTVTGLNVTISMTWTLGGTHIANGTASADFLSMNGAFTQSNGFDGTWTATRSSI